MEASVALIHAKDDKIIQSICEIEKEAFGQGGLNAWMIVPLIRHGRVFGLFLNDKVVGEAQFIRDWDFPDKVYLIGVAIHPDYRRRGFGTLLLQEAIQILKKDEIHNVELTVDPGNIGAISVYHDKLGFTTKSQRHDEYGPGEHRLVMELDIGDR